MTVLVAGHSAHPDVSKAAETLEHCLAAIDAAIGKQAECEVIVVDDGSTDRTADIAQRFPVRLLRSALNEGRLRARLRGARAARADRVLFVDARVLIPRDTLEVLQRLNYAPIMGGTTCLNVADGTALDRFLYLLRRRIYAPYYPQRSSEAIVWLTPETFSRVPKGMGCVYVDKAHFLASLPAQCTPQTSDDTRLFANLVTQRPILVSGELAITYLQRPSLGSGFGHLFARGALFADFHLQPGRPYYTWWTTLVGLSLVAALTLALRPQIAPALVALILLSLLVVSARLAEKPPDYLRLLVVLPGVLVCFGLGVLRGKLHQLRRAVHWPREQPG